ncbi:MAG: hypothetical protein KKB94_03325, partial [Proteobacteria bacterium]|nr:hypothetical protein [Pseudomonadota bacterium]
FGMDASKKQGEKKMRKISLLTVILIAAMVICMGTASAQTASVGYKGMLGNGGGEGNLMSMNGLSFRGWVDNIGWEGTLFFGRDKEEYRDANGPYSWEDDFDIWALQLQAMYAIITNENSKLYLGLNVAYGRANYESSDSYWGSEEEDTDFWTAGPLVGAQYSFQGIPELSFNWEVGYTFLNQNEDESDNGYPDGTRETDLDGINTTVGVHYAF